MQPLLEVKGLTKSFPGVQALTGVDFTLHSGENHALIGANGAGKSTLIKILCGIHEQDSGDIRCEGQTVGPLTPARARAHRIAAIHQELSLIPNLSVAENIMLAGLPSSGLFLNAGALYRRAEDVLAGLGLRMNVRARVSSLSIAEQQMVEVARAVHQDARILIMDEPTSSLTAQETERLFAIIRTLKAAGGGVIFVSHRLSEIYEICDRVTVLRDGAWVGTYQTSELSEKRLIELMVGRELGQMYPKRTVPIGQTVLSVRHLSRGAKVRDVSFELRQGEILGLTGLLGSGRTETARCLFGIDRPEHGQICLDGKPVRLTSPRIASRLGLALVPENRKEQGLVLSMNLIENTLLGSRSLGFVRRPKSEEGLAANLTKAFRIKCSSLRQLTRDLSGGNQQKVVLARWAARKPRILILDEPTRGIDVEAKAEVHSLIGGMVAEGVAVLLISSEIEEILGLCDRVIVLYEGRLVGEVDRDHLSKEALLAYSHGLA